MRRPHPQAVGSSECQRETLTVSLQHETPQALMMPVHSPISPNASLQSLG